MTSSDFAGLNIEEPENWGVTQQGIGYDLRDAANVVIDVRSPGGLKLRFGVNQCSTALITLPPSTTYTRMTIPLNTLNCSDYSNVHVLFTIGVSGADSPNGGVARRQYSIHARTKTAVYRSEGF